MTNWTVAHDKNAFLLSTATDSKALNLYGQYFVSACPCCTSTIRDAETAMAPFYGDELAVSSVQFGAQAAQPLAAGAVGVSATGDDYIDGVIWGSKWNGPITYSFPDSAADYEFGYPEATALGFGQVTFNQMQAVRYILEGASPVGGGPIMRYGSVEAVTNLSIVDAGTNGADLRIARSSAANPTAYAYLPSNSPEGGDIWFGTSFNYGNPQLGDYSFATHIHELGHALGLKHGHEGGGPGNTAVPADRDALEFTIMTYRSYVGGPTSGGYTNEQFGFPQTFMMLDIAALQHLYGADYGTNSGDTVYRWSPTTGQMSVNGVGQGTPGANRVFLTIWDGGGNDTYDMSNYSNAVEIDLRPGRWSITSDTQRAHLGNGNFANGTVYNALLFQGNTASLIENAIGGSGNDTIIGNATANTLIGGGGSDTLTGLGGHDTLDGKGGADTMIGGPGNDRYFVNHLNDAINESPGAGSDTAYVTISGYVLAANVEFGILKNQNGATLTGNDTGATLVGHNGDDILNGGSSKDVLKGLDGADIMAGGANDDTYYVRDLGDVIVELAGGGNDTAYVQVSGYTVASEVEKAALWVTGTLTGGATANTLLGTNGNDTLNGGGGNDVLGGKGGADTLNGDAGNDSLNGGPGADTLTGGSENDVFLFRIGEADGDSVTDFDGNGAAAGDQLRFVGYGSVADGATFIQLNATTWQVTSADGLTQEVITLSNAAAVHASDVIFL
jgi:serralysin